ncbi:DUF4011 domain-containing protein [Demequina pelophila]|uniref:DUF4011 domain-containing protein n=1 Tax=Demequina pelophila TaxID=1638984 RepID=UPI00078377C3|nr:DUF4011 domain-containing protein [Demequina pelophila]
MTTPVDIVGRTLDAIIEPVGAFVEQVMAASAPGKDWVALLEARDEAQRGKPVHHSPQDPRFLLRVLTENRVVFRGKVPDEAFAWASELRTLGNKWAHREPLDRQSARRGVDTAALLVHGTGAVEAAVAIRGLASLLDEVPPTASAPGKPTPAQSADAHPSTPAVQVRHQPAGVHQGAFTPAALTLEGFGVEVQLAHQDAVNFALAHNRVSPLLGLSVGNVSDEPVEVTSIEIDLVAPVDDALADPVRLGQAMLEPGRGITAQRTQLAMRLKARGFAAVAEALPASSLSLTVHTSRGRLHGTAPVTVLAWNEWWAASVHDALAAFVRPGDPVIAHLAGEASDLLAERTQNPSFLGYQGGSTRAVEEARAVFHAMVARRIRYIDPPPSFEGTGQKIRDHSEVLEGRFGTCLDLATTYAAALEFIGLNPVLVLAKGHAFAGFLADEGQLDELALPVATHANTIANLVDSGSLIAVETTDTTASDTPRSFDTARARTREWTSRRFDDLRYLLDVRAAHRRIRPLPGASAPVEVRDLPETPAAPPRAPASVLRRPDEPERPQPTPGERAAETYPPRVDKWRNALLDLSFRNPLLNLRTRTSGLDLHIPSGSLPSFEDGIAAGAQYRLVPQDKIADVHRAQGARSARDVSAEELARILSDERAAYCSVTQDAYPTKLTNLQRRARTVEEETGANNLFLTLGSLNWTDGSRERVDAPLFLLPVRLVGSRTRGFSLQIEEGAYAVPNQCLLEKLRLTFNLTIPAYEEPQTDASGIDLPDALQQIRLALLDARLDFRVDEVARLAIIQFSTLQMWQDLSANWEAFAANPVVRHMIETPTDSFGDGVDEAAFDASLESEAFLPIPADGSQLEAIQWAAEGRSFVLEGPPGTGKSQTITNMIAHLLATGKRVLFIAEKQAALSVVKRRLESSGIGAFALDVHGRTQTPAEVRRQLREALNATAESNPAAWEALRSQYASLVSGLTQYPDALHAEGPAGDSAWTARQTILALGAFGEEARGPAADPAVAHDAEAAAAARAAAPTAAEALQILAENPARHRWALAGGGVDVRGNAEDLEACVHEVAAAAAALAADACADIVRQLRTSQEWGALVTWLDALARGPVPTPREARPLVTHEWSRLLGEAERALAAAHAHAGEPLAAFTPGVFGFDLEGPLAAAQEADGKLFKKRRRRAVVESLRAVLAEGAQPDLAGLTAMLRAALDAQSVARAAARQVLEVPGLGLPGDFNPLDPATASLPHDRARTLHAAATLAHAGDHVAQEAERFLAARTGMPAAPAPLATLPSLDGPGAAGSAAAPASAPAPTAAGGAVLARLAHAWDRLTTLVGADDAAIARWQGDRTLLAALEADLGDWKADAAGASFVRLTRWVSLMDACAGLRACHLGAFADAVLAGEVEAEELDRLARLAIARAALEERLDTTGLAGFDAARRASLAQRFLSSGEDVRKQLLAELPARIVAARSFEPGRFRGRVGELDREASRKRGGLTIRGMFEKYGSVIGEVTPCLLMSPHSVARFLPHGALDVDVVIFDEASQIRVADAVGAMGRGASVIVVGDSRQMPPTSFAQVNIDDPDAGFEPAADVLAPPDQESILSEAVEVRMPRLWLTWHYRSEDESLIAFSNERYYDGRLSSFPGPPGRRAGMGVSFRRVDGVFDRGRTRTNAIEADAIVADIRARLADDPDASIGVVTFNAQQADLLLTRLEECGDPRVAAALEREDEADALFVKNLENVQGDERDVVMFSLAFSVDPETGRLPLNFGPLNRAGGERRLNVAITRARREVVMFASFEPHDIDERRTSAAALLDLKDYLARAKEAGSDQARLGALGASDLHRDEVRDALRERGLEVREHVGLSSFTVDLAMRVDAGSPWVAVLLDGPGWRARRTVGDRDALPQAVLVGRMGWRRVERVYLPTWLHAREDVLARLVAAAQAAARDEDAREAEAAAEADADAAGPTSDAGAGDAGAGDAGAGESGAQSAEAAAGDAALDASADAPIRAHVAAPAPAAASAPPVHEDSPDAGFVPASDEPQPGLDVSILDELPSRSATARVREAAFAVVEIEGPVEEARLARIVANRCGLGTVRRTRIDAILAALPRERRERTPLGTFVWPEGVTPESYAGFRPTPDGVDRPLDEVSPHELANAMASVARSAHGIEAEELMRETARVFDFSRLTARVRGRLEGVLAWATAEGRLAVEEGLVIAEEAAR